MHTPLREIATLFLRLGATSFGGPAAHVAMMEDEVVQRRRWMSREEFLDLLGVSQMIPGPNSTELAIHVGYARAGWPGLLVAGACFILPAMLIVWAIAWAYVRFGALPDVSAVLSGIKPVVLAIVAQALFVLGRTALVSAMTLSIAGLSLVGVLLGVHEVVVLGLAAALAGLDWRLTRGGNLWERAPSIGVMKLGGPALALGGGGGAALVAAFSLGKLFFYFMKAGALLFGSGYVLIAFIRADFVTRTGWLTGSQLLDAIAVGQFTPGPVFTTATFVGYLLGGNVGAVVATVGIFLPAFVFVAISAPIVHRFKHAPGARAVLGGLNAASLALMAAVTAPLAAGVSTQPWLSAPLFLVALFLLVRLRVNSAWLVLGGGLIAWLAVTAGLATSTVAV